MPAAPTPAPPPSDRSIVVVGGGIAGLYAAYLLGLLHYDVQVFEMSDRWGGRIHSETFEVKGGEDFIAEFGPMRFEAHLQERLRRLCFHLEIGFESFPPTRAPIGTTHYDLTATEDSFESAADLLEWAVLRMFFEAEVEPDLVEIQEAEEAAAKKDPKRGNKSGHRQLARLKLHMDGKLFCKVTGSGEALTVELCDDQSIQRRLRALRAKSTLRGVKGATRLAQLGLWKGLSEVMSPGALARVRDGGTFYHFIADNPSAADWGIFWLRQSSVAGGLFRFKPETAQHGTYSLVEALRKKIEAECPDNVHLHLRCEVVDVAPAKRPHEVDVRVVCDQGKDGSYTFTQRADDVILALPQQPLLVLADHFPVEVRRRVESVMPMPLLKAFLVVEDPWWRHHLEAQAFAWLVPTRELHFFRPSLADCPAIEERGPCECEQRLHGDRKKLGMVMLYTDQPAIRYWQSLTTPEQRCKVVWDTFSKGPGPLKTVESNPNGLLATLIRRLLMIPEPGLARQINLREQQIMAKLEKRKPGLAKRIKASSGGTLKLAEQILHATESDPTAQKDVTEILVEEEPHLDITIDENWHEWLKLALRYQPNAGNLQEGAEQHARKVLAYGIRDWAAAPFGGACHVWLPDKELPHRADRDKLISFALRGQPDGERRTNLHVCGEAFSEFQGFIEGALRTAEAVVDRITRGTVPLAGSDLVSPSAEAEWQADHSPELTHNWNELIASLQ